MRAATIYSLHSQAPERRKIAKIVEVIQRGGVTSVFDRTLASRMGVEAVAALKDGKSGVMVGLMKSKFIEVPFNEVMEKKKSIEPKLFDLARILGVIL